jgi:hypothetical protein
MRQLDTTLPLCPPGKEYGFNRAEIDRAMFLQGLINYIRDHGHPCRLEKDGRIRAAVYCSYVRIEDIQGTGRRGFWMVASCEPTLKAARDFLGY